MKGQTVGHYRILGELSRGGMSVVYRALDLRLNRHVALKCLPAEKIADRDWRARFVREARAAAALEHPHIAVIHEVDEVAGTAFIAMELLHGSTLRELLRRGPLTPARALELGTEIAEGLSHAHDRGLVHRDLKPSNVIVTEQGHAKIIDFGLAKVGMPLPPSGGVETSEVDTPLRGEPSSGLLVGTVAYMSPEQARSEEVDHRSDIFSFGILLFEMLTGERPFAAPSGPELLGAIINDPPSQLRNHIFTSSVDELQRILDKCLAKAPSARYQSMKDLVVDLRSVRYRLSRAAPVTAATSRRTASWLAAAVLAVALAVVALPNAPWFSSSFDLPPYPVPLTSLEGWESDPALSPDGTFVAMGWDRGGSSPSQLYIQQLSSPEVVQLTHGPVPASHPAWSPDGLEIAFLEREGGTSYALSLLPMSVGEPRRIAAITAAFPGLDWSPDGRWLAVVHRPSSMDPESIFLVSRETVEWKRVTHPQSTSRGDRNAVFSPSGRSIAFVRWREGYVSEVFVQPLDAIDDSGATLSTEPSMVLSHDGLISDLDFTPDGRALLFASYWRGTRGLWSIALESREAERLPFGDDAVAVSVGRAKGDLVFSRRSTDTNLWRTPGPNASAMSTPVKWIASTRDDWSPEYSPDGRFVAFASDRSGQPQIWIWDSLGGEFSRLAFEGGATMPRWSPDGRYLALAGDVGGNFDVYVASVIGGQTRRLTEEPGTDVPGAWSPDGRYIYFSSDRTGRYEVWRLPATGGPAECLSESGGILPRLSTDGRHVYYVGEAFKSVWRRPTHGGVAELVLEKETYRASLALWDNQILYLHGNEQGSFAVESFDLESREVVTLAELGPNTRIGKYGGLAVSPDGRWVLFPRDDGLGTDLMLVKGFFRRR